MTVLQQLIIFIKYVNREVGEAETGFLSTRCIHDPQGVNTEVVTGEILDVLKECDLEIRNLKSFVSDGVSVMT